MSEPTTSTPDAIEPETPVENVDPAETFGFDAEVRQLLDLVIHSLYSERDVFLRELISNASDALDKARVRGLEQGAELREAAGEPRIDVRVDPVAGTLTVSDNGIGLTRSQAIENLGTIAKSGTKSFVQALKEQQDHNLIGQFGVGFYAAFMVADQVDVLTQSAEAGAEGVRWHCDGSTEYSISTAELPDRGTQVVLHLKEDCGEFLDADRLRDIVKRYSEFVSYPIFVNEEQANEPRALWSRSPSEVEDDEYTEFYKHVTGDFADPASHLHWHADAPIQYQAVIYIPAQKPQDLNHADGRRVVRLYTRRVLIDEEASFLLPDYLRFVRGVVDTEDLQLNVSRELVQQTAVVDKLKGQLTSKVLRHLQSIAKKDPDEYRAIWTDFGSVLKEGLHNVSSDKDKKRLISLARFNSTRFSDANGQVSLAEYVESMPEGQDAIYYLIGPDYDSVARSPHLEGFRKKGYEVLLSWDTVDEWSIPSLGGHEGKALVSIARGQVDLGADDDDETTEAAPTVSEDFVGWVGGVLSGEVKEVRSSARLTESASVLVDDQFGISSNLERIMKQLDQQLPASQRILEINPGHPLVRSLESLHASGRTGQAEPLAWLLLDQARLVEGQVKDPVKLVERLQALSALAAQALGVDDAPASAPSHPVPDDAPASEPAAPIIEGELLDPNA